MKFIDKLIEETQQGLLDYIWQYSESGDKFKYSAEKHPLKDLTFSLNDIVTNRLETEKVLTYKNELFRKDNPIFLAAKDPLFFSSHFYAPSKICLVYN